MNASLTIGNRVFDESSLPFIIAEAGVNHENNFDEACRMIEEAAKAGADAIKFQTYKASRLAVKNSPAYWDQKKEPHKTQYELFSRFDSFEKRDYRRLAKVAEENGILFMSTPFDDDAVDFLEELMPAYKVASADLTNDPFLRRIARKGKPVILSTGASTLSEIHHAVKVLEETPDTTIALLHCVLSYPTEDQNANLEMIRGLIQEFPNFIVGYSDHTMPDSQMFVVTAAYILGARVIEKHFTLDKGRRGNDHYHAMDPCDLRNLVDSLKRARMCLGSTERKVLECEVAPRLHARRSLVTARPLHKGEVITQSMLTYKRPGNGISPRYINEVVGKLSKRDISEDTVLQWSDLEPAAWLRASSAT